MKTTQTPKTQPTKTPVPAPMRPLDPAQFGQVAGGPVGCPTL